MNRKDFNLEIENQFLKLENDRLHDELSSANKIIIHSSKSILLWMENCQRYQKDITAIKELLRESMEHDLPILSANSIANKTYHCMFLN